MSSANSIGIPFIELRKVESTNNYAIGLVHEGMAQHGTVVFAHEQTKGKGQRNKQWISAPNHNVMLSLIVEPFGLSVTQLFLLSMSVASGVREFFNKYAGDTTKIKWPNDIYWCDRKAGGILIENIVQGKNWKYAVIGIGLNINQTDFGNFDKAVSLKTITSKTYNTVDLAKELVEFISKSFGALQNNRDSVSTDYHKNLYKLDERIQLKKEDLFIEGVLKGVTSDGMLLIKEREKESKFKVGEVQWL